MEKLLVKDSWGDELEFEVVEDVSRELGIPTDHTDEIIITTRTTDAEEIRRVGVLVLPRDEAKALHNWLGNFLGFECLEK